MTRTDYRNDFLIADGNNIVTRCFQARFMGSEEPPPREIVLTALRMIQKQAEALHVSGIRVQVAFDNGDSYRKAIFEGYKGDRRVRPDGLQAALDLFPSEMPGEWAYLGKMGWEADDVIATRARTIIENRGTAAIYSTDKDLLQLIEPFHCIVCQPLKDGKTRDWTPQEFYVEYGFEPRFMPDYKALTGDKSDCLPQVPGLGEVWGKRLMQAHYGIDPLYDALKAQDEENLSKLQKAILACEDQVRLNLVLATLQEVPGL